MCASPALDTLVSGNHPILLHLEVGPFRRLVRIVLWAGGSKYGIRAYSVVNYLAWAESISSRVGPGSRGSPWINPDDEGHNSPTCCACPERRQESGSRSAAVGAFEDQR